MPTFPVLAYRQRGGQFVAESLTFAGVSAEAASLEEVLERVGGELLDATKDGTPQALASVAITSVAVLAATQRYASHTYTAIVTRDAEGYSSICPALGVASQGETFDEALAMLRDAAMLYLEYHAPAEHDEVVLVAGVTPADFLAAL